MFRVLALNAATGSAFLNTKYAEPKPNFSFNTSAKYGEMGSLGGRTKSLIGRISLASSSNSLRPQHTSCKSSIKKPLIKVPSSSNEFHTDLISSGLNGVPANLMNCLSVIIGYSFTILRKYSLRNSIGSIDKFGATVLNPPLKS